MANTFWIKLYLEILDDPKMGALSDRLYRRAIEMFLMAGELGAKIQDMSESLRAMDQAAKEIFGDGAQMRLI